MVGSNAHLYTCYALFYKNFMYIVYGLLLYLVLDYSLTLRRGKKTFVLYPRLISRLISFSVAVSRPNVPESWDSRSPFSPHAKEPSFSVGAVPDVERWYRPFVLRLCVPFIIVATIVKRVVCPFFASGRILWWLVDKEKQKRINVLRIKCSFGYSLLGWSDSVCHDLTDCILIASTMMKTSNPTNRIKKLSE